LPQNYLMCICEEAELKQGAAGT